jgi:hypothetical protein
MYHILYIIKARRSIYVYLLNYYWPCYGQEIKCGGHDKQSHSQLWLLTHSPWKTRNEEIHKAKPKRYLIQQTMKELVNSIYYKMTDTIETNIFLAQI